MMRLTVLSLFISLILSVSLPLENKIDDLGASLVKDRLIQLKSDGKPQLMSESEIYALLRKGQHFRDLTDIDTAGLGRALAPTPLPIPTSLNYSNQVNLIQSKLNVNNMEQFLIKFSNIHTRYYKSVYAKEASDQIFNYINALLTGYTTNQVKVEQVVHKGWNQTSIVVKVVGNSIVSDETVIVGCHLDSINSLNPKTGRSPGADDDGSGVTTVLEVFNAFVKSQLKLQRSVEFHFYSGEEEGLRGSEYLALQYKLNNRKVVGMLQLDMTGYLVPLRKFKIITDYTDKDLSQFLRLLVTKYTALEYFDKDCGYACSDHASWYENGFRSARAAESERNFRLHTTDDTMQFVNFTDVKEFAKLAVSFFTELALPLQ